jgi:hypothetical protein
MSTIVTRAGKGSALTNTEVDANFTNLNNDKVQTGGTVANLTITACVVSNDLTVDTNTLKVDSANNRVGILDATPAVSLDAGSATDAVHVPTGTTGQRPTGAAGMFRYNSTTSGFEGYSGGAWGQIGGAIADDAVTTAKIADNAVTGAKLADSVDVTTGLTVGGASNGVAITNGQIALKNSGAVSKIDFYCESSNAHYTRLQSAPHGSYSGNITLTLPASDGDSGQVLSTNGSGVMSWATVGGAYSGFSILTTTANLAAKGQYVCDHPSTAFTVTLPAGSAGDTIVIANAGAATVTIARTSSQKINSVAEDGTLPQGNSIQIVYVSSDIGWFVI